MTADRVCIGPAGSGRITNQAMNMESQQSQFDAAKTFVPGVKWFTDARDRLIKFYGMVRWLLRVSAGIKHSFCLRILQPSVITLVLEKKGNWNIVHTHSSSLNPPNQQ